VERYDELGDHVSRSRSRSRRAETTRVVRSPPPAATSDAAPAACPCRRSEIEYNLLTGTLPSEWAVLPHVDKM
jgi:hypothetical protein